MRFLGKACQFKANQEVRLLREETGPCLSTLMSNEHLPFIKDMPKKSLFRLGRIRKQFCFFQPMQCFYFSEVHFLKESHWVSKACPRKFLFPYFPFFDIMWVCVKVFYQNRAETGLPIWIASVRKWNPQQVNL